MLSHRLRWRFEFSTFLPVESTSRRLILEMGLINDTLRERGIRNFFFENNPRLITCSSPITDQPVTNYFSSPITDQPVTDYFSSLLPLYRGRRFAGDIIDHAVDSLNLVHDAVGDFCQQVIWQACPIGGHKIVAGNRP